MESRVDQLPILPEDFLQIELPPNLTLATFKSFSQTARRFYSIFPDKRKRVNSLRELLRHGVLGKLGQAETIWRAFPELLTCRDTIYFPNRSYIDADGKPLSQPIDIPFYQNPGRPKSTNRTFYQILLRNSEFEAAAKAGALMTPEERRIQFLEIFPDGKIKKYNFDLEKAKSLLQAFFDELVKDEDIGKEYVPDQMGDSTRKALYAIYDYAKSQLEDETGLLFDPNFLLEAMKLYDEKATGQFKDNLGKYNLWCIRLEEWLKACSGTGFLRPLSQGLVNGLAANRSTGAGCVLFDDSFYFAFHRDHHSIPGFHFWADVYGRSRRDGAADRTARGKFAAIALSKLLSSKDESRDKLYAAICPPTQLAMSNSLK